MLLIEYENGIRIKMTFKTILNLFYIAMLLSCLTNKDNAQSKIRVTGYYGGWQQGWYNNGRLPSGQIDFSTVDYIIHFGLVPNSDASLDFSTNSILQTNSDSLLTAAHNAGKKVLICIGGWGSGDAFRSATSPLRLISFVSNIVKFILARGYDGVDIDWEVLESSDSQQYLAFIKLLRTMLNTVKPGALITAAVAWQPAIIASAQQYLDQINIMTYDMSGPWNGWVSWFNSPVYSGGNRFSSNGQLLPSIDNMTKEFIAAGISKNKISVGIDFYGYIWKGGSGTTTGGVTGPLQSWLNAPDVIPNVPYYQIMNTYFLPKNYRWDSTAAAPYLQIDDSCDINDKFITYDDEHECREIVNYAVKNNLGGVFIWELGAGVTSNGSQPLVNAIKQAETTPDTIPPVPVVYSPGEDSSSKALSVVLSWYPIPEADYYRVQISADSLFSNIIDDLQVDTASSISVANLQPDKKYYWRVNAVNNSGQSPFTSPVFFKTPGPQLLPPVLSAPANDLKNTPVTINFTWRPVVNADSYELQIASSSDFCELNIDTVISIDTTFSYSGLENEHTYYWHIKAFSKNNTYSMSNYSIERTFVTAGEPPAVPQIVSPENNTEDVSLSPTFNWTSSAYANSYELRLSLNSDFNNLVIDSANIAGLELKVNSLTRNTVYYWDVRAFNPAGESGWSNYAKFTTGAVDSSPLLSDKPPAQFELMQNYPNPFNNSTIIEFGLPVESGVQLSIYNPVGKLVKIFTFGDLRAGMYKMSFGDNGLASGMYFYAVKAVSFDKASPRSYFEVKKMVLIK